MAGYSAFRIFEESLRIDNSEHFLGLRLNFYVAGVLTIAGLAWFVISQRRAPAPVTAGDTDDSTAAGADAEAEEPSDTSAEAEDTEPDSEETAEADDAVAGDRK